MSYYRRPYLSTMPISSILAPSSSKREYCFTSEYSAGGKEWTRPRFYPVYEWCPSHDYSYETTREVRRPIYVPDYRTVHTTTHGYSPRYYTTTGGTTTTIRSGPAYGGITTRTYRY